MDLAHSGSQFPLPIEQYGDSHLSSLSEVLLHRVSVEPFNLAVSAIFFCAILHTFFASKFTALSKRCQNEFWKEIFHFLGEIEIPFGLWVLPLIVVVSFDKGWESARHYVNEVARFDEAIFVVVVMAISASSPIVYATERCVQFLAGLLGGGTAAWWFCILTLGPLLGSLVTEPAAMTVCALLLSKNFFELRPSKMLSYLTLGTLFLNVSIGGSLTHFAAPPVLMVATRWSWDTPFMLEHFGWKAALAVLIVNAMVFLTFRREFSALNERASAAAQSPENLNIPASVVTGSVIFLAWAVLCSHQMAYLVGGFLMFLGFVSATSRYQSELNLRSALLVGFFLAGLIVHGGLQAWWIEPLLSRAGDLQLFLGSMLLSAFNDNAAITYLASFAPQLSLEGKYLVVAGALCGGGLTVIANAPNPIGFALLGKHFQDGIAPMGLLLGALFPTLIAAALFFLL